MMLPEAQGAAPEVRAIADHLTALVEEQAALRRVATAVAADEPAERVLELVVEETARLVDADFCVGSRIEDDGFRVIGSHTDGDDDIFPVGATLEFLPGSAIESAVRTGET